MKANLGPVDRGIRLVLGLAILGAGVVLGSWWGLVGLLPLGTALAGRCCAYVPFGISTCRVREPAGR